MADRNYSLLVVSSDRMLLRRLTRFLDVFGYEVRQAVTAAGAEAAVDAGRVDFLVVDEGLGKQTAQICRAVRRTADGYTYALLLTKAPEATDLTEALDAGYDDFLSSPVVYGELLSRLRAGARVLEFERRLLEQQECDPATGLSTSGALLAQMRDRQAQLGSPRPSSGRVTKSATLLVMDVDFFRRLHKKLGYTASQKLASALAERLQTADPSLTWNALNIDRFAAVLDHQSETDAAKWAKTWLHDLFQQAFVSGQEKIHLSASAGVAELSADQPPQKTLDRALAALQLAKASGRGIVATSHEVDDDNETWTQLAAGGNLFATTRARDVMIPCSILLGADDTFEQAQAMFDQTKLSAIPVVDAEGRFAGVVTSEQFAERKSQPPRPRASGSVRLLKQIMVADIPKFDESATLSELMEFFTGDGSSLAVIVRERRPTGIVFCQSLAALNERLTPKNFTPPTPYHPTSDYLMVPDPTAMEAV